MQAAFAAQHSDLWTHTNIFGTRSYKQLTQYTDGYALNIEICWIFLETDFAADGLLKFTPESSPHLTRRRLFTFQLHSNVRVRDYSPASATESVMNCLELWWKRSNINSPKGIHDSFSFQRRLGLPERDGESERARRRKCG